MPRPSVGRFLSVVPIPVCIASLFYLLLTLICRLRHSKPRATLCQMRHTGASEIFREGRDGSEEDARLRDTGGALAPAPVRLRPEQVDCGGDQPLPCSRAHQRLPGALAPRGGGAGGAPDGGER